MKKLFVLFFAFLSFTALYAQIDESKVEIGIVEHLGQTIPLDLQFKNEKNETVKIRDIIKKPTILSLVYFNCPGLCSPLLDGLSTVIEEVPLTLGKEYQVLTVSFDATDTPEKAVEKKKNFLRKHSKDKAANWAYLTGDSTAIYTLANSVGFKFKRTGLDFAHGASIIILSPDGKITRYLYGLKFLPFDLKLAIFEAQKGLPRPTINKVLNFCYSYDPAGKRYALEVTKVSATIIIFFALLLFGVLAFKTKKKSPSQAA